MPSPYKVGLTGGVGCGKSLVSEMFSSLGVPVIDADEIVHELISTNGPLVREIIDVFGNSIVDESKNLARDKLRLLIFSDNEARKKLETLLHPRVYDAITEKIGEISAPYCILSIPLLIETGAEEMVDTVLVIDCPVSLQIERVARRDGVSSRDVQKIINSQVSRISRLEAADEVISNDGDIEELRQSVEALHKEYSQRAKTYY